MIGIVVVSHSRPLGNAALALALEMVPEPARPKVAVAAGLDETAFGTDAAAIGDAIGAVDSPDGVLVLMDLGSALMSAEMALEFVEPKVAERVRLSAAPLVEGLVSAFVTASTGASLDEVAAEADGSLAAKREHLAGPAPASAEPVPAPVPTGPELVFNHTVRNRHGLHARPAAALVSRLRGLEATVLVRNATSGAGPANARSIGSVAALGLRAGDVLEAAVQGPDAEAALARLKELADSDFGESAAATTLTAPQPEAMPIGTGRQIVVGPARVLAPEVDTSGYVPGDPATERTRLDAARATVGRRLRTLAEHAHGDIFSAQAAILSDPELTDDMDSDVAAASSAPDAVRARTTALAGIFAALDDPYLRDRATDIRSLQRLLLGALTGADPEPEQSPEPHVLVIGELDAATAAQLGPDTLAVITTHGGATGHGVIVASSRGLPVLTGRDDLTDLADGTLIALDAAGGRVWVDPSSADLAEVRNLADDRAAEAVTAAAAAREPARTRAGRLVLVEANVATPADARLACDNGADGCGLVRTELLFGDSAVAPTAEEQAAGYVAIGRAVGGPITVRTWDPGGDKPLPFLPQPPEANPMLGARGIRAMRGREDLLRTQLRAVALAAREIEVRVMVPMVTEPAEVEWARSLLTEVLAETGRTPPVGGPATVAFGMMVEVPAAALRAGEFTELVDFVSIGTNDLTQYTTAADRGNGVVSQLARADSAAVLELIGTVGRAFAGKPVAVCGDLASNPDASATLIGLGVTELSVRPPLVGLVKQAVRRA